MELPNGWVRLKKGTLYRNRTVGVTVELYNKRQWAILYNNDYLSGKRHIRLFNTALAAMKKADLYAPLWEREKEREKEFERSLKFSIDVPQVVKYVDGQLIVEDVYVVYGKAWKRWGTTLFSRRNTDFVEVFPCHKCDRRLPKWRFLNCLCDPEEVKSALFRKDGSLRCNNWGVIKSYDYCFSCGNSVKAASEKLFSLVKLQRALNALKRSIANAERRTATEVFGEVY